MSCFASQILSLAIGISTFANVFVFSGNVYMVVGIWGLVMQLGYSSMMEHLPEIEIRSLSFLGLCSGLYVHNCLWFYYIPCTSLDHVVLMLISVWISPFFLIMLGTPSNRKSVEVDIESGMTCAK